MKHTKEQTYKAREAYDLYWDSYLTGDVKTLSSLLDGHYTQVGSVEGEVFFNKKDAVQFVVDTIDQIVGFLEMRNREIKSESVGQFILFHEFCDLYVLSENDWVFYAKFRASSLMTENEEGWKMIHQHTSVPDSKAEGGDNIAIQTISKENLQLRDAIKRRTIELENKTNELEIEAALERIRSKSMAMRSSEELQEVAHLLFQELQKLGGNFWGAGIGLCKENSTEDEFWFAYENGMLPPVSIPNNVDPTHQAMYEEWLEKKGYLAQVKEGAELKAHYDYMLSVPSVKPFFENILESGLSFPSWQTWHAAYFSHGYILSITLEDYPKPQVFERFAKVFDQAYTRFLDLQKAEEQTREAEIELALERVRARTMAMHSSSELAEASILLDQQVRSLGIQTWGCAFHIYAEDEAGDYEWFSSANGSLPFYKTPREKFFLDFYERGQRGEKFYVKEFAGAECKDHYDYLKTIPIAGDSLIALEESGIPLPTYQIDHIAFFKHGYILFITYEPVPEAYEVFQRFAKVFEQTYTRFLDLQKAEAQAREAQIEAALEKVRSRSLAMHNSKELNEVVKVLFEKLNELQIPSTAVAIQTFTDDSKDMDVFVCGDVGTGLVINQYHLPYFDHPIINDYIHAHEESLAFYKGEYSVAEKDSFYDVVLKLPELTNLPSEVERMIRKSSHYSVTMAPSGKSIVAVNDFVGKPLSEPDIAILKRFSKVFDQAYTRFLDLQKAEAQAREAQIEAALERIRSRSLAMYKTDDLRNVVAVLFEQMQSLSVDMGFASVSIFIFEEGSRNINQWIPLPDGVASLSVPYFEHPISSDLFDAKENGADYFAKVYTLDEKNTWLKAGFELTDYKNLPEEFRTSLLEAPGYAISITLAKNSGICIPSFLGMLPSPEDVSILRRVGKVFEQAYIRFLDLQKAEAQAKEAEIELALERVRARSMAMHSSDELLDAADVMLSELKKLKIDALRIGICTVDADTGASEIWTRSELSNAKGKGKQHILGSVPKGAHPVFEGMVAAWKKKKPIFSSTRRGDEVKEYYKTISPFLPYPLPEVYNEQETISAYFFTEGSINVVSIEPMQAKDEQILLRFAKVFGQTYTRFQDLQKAEAQAREAQIEAALEKVRSRSLAMHKSDELNEVVSIVFEKLKELQIPATAVGIGIAIEGSKDLDSFVCGQNEAGLVITNYRLPYFDNQIPKDFYNALEKQLDFFVGHYSKAEKDAFYNYLIEHTAEFKHLPEDILRMIFDSPTYSITSVAVRNAVFNINDFEGKTLAESEIDIIKRFAKVFDQAYTRFLDLKRAEAQTREAQIEASLERIRAKAMAMHHSDELDEVLAVLCEQFDTLGIFPMSTHMTVLDIPNNKFTFRETGKFGNRSFGEQTVALNAMDTWKDMVESWKNADPFSVNRLHFPKETLPQVWEVFHDSFSSMPEGSKITPNDYPDGIYHTAGKHPFGYIGMNQVHPATEAEEQIVIKFASEFGRAYQRFLDLQKAEAQAREAQIEAALERIRGQVASMRESTELLEIVVTMRTEFVALGHEAHYFWHMRWLPNIYEKAMTSGDGTQIGMVMSLPRRIHGDIKLVADWEKGTDPILVLAMETETAVDYVDKMITWGDFEQVDPQAPTLDDIRHIQGLTFVMARTTHGEIGFSLPGSVPNPPQEDMDTLVRFAKVFDLAYKRFEDLKKAEYQARETQIELALERVRSRSMAMQNSSELKDVIQVVYQQFVALEIPIEHTGFIMDYKDREDMNIWLADSNQFQSEITFPYFDSPHWNSFLGAKAKGENFFTNLLDFETKNKFYRGLFEFIPDLPKEKQEFYFSKDGLSISTVLLDNVGLYIENYTTTPFTTEENQVLMRFGKVFQQTYTRFLDLQKAEAQTRNSQIDLAVERVRAKALAMHNSSQILEVVAELKNEMLGLEIPGVVAATIYLKEEAGFIRMWDLTSVQDTADGFQVTLDLKFKLADTDPGFFVRKIWNNTERYFVEKQEKDDMAITIEWLRQYNAEEADNVSEFIATNPFEYVIHPTVKLANGKMSLDILNTAPPAEMESIMVKMGAAFDLAYKRFLDLQKAEAQAREAQIELGLERVRARAMAMQNTDELSDLVDNLLSELTKLDFSLTFCIINIINEADQSNMVWAANPEEGKAPESYYMKFEDYPFHHAMMREWKAQTPKFVYVMEGMEKEIYDDYLYVDTEFSRFPEEVQKANRALDKYVASFVFSQFGGLQTVGNDYLSDDSLDILYRFGKVFDLTYTRFNDLQKAEARARESQIETALERVRSRTMGMQQSEELGEVATVLFNEMNGLVDDLWTCGFVLCEENRKEDEWWLSMDSGFTRGFFLPNVGDYAHETLYEGWEKGKPFRSVELEGKILSDHYEWLMEVPIAKQIFADMEASGIPRPKWQKLHAAYFKTGYLVIITEVPCDEEEIFKRFAQVFDLTYTRFLDLQQKEEQGKKLVEEKLRLELTLKDLQATQAQLIQAEKMASLGELTAGIAHEIQNPLNFVNNFSEVSGELIDEMNEEIEKGDFEEVKFIANDLKENLFKINHHGKRADAIVKGMLEHSRANKGEKAPTDLNALADEFVRLSYHGLRAKDKSFNADFKLELDPDLPKVNVVASDIGRVILNLVNNAFYACAERSRSTVNEKSKSFPQDYKPEVIIKSKKTEKGIELFVQDNGSGIPDSIKEKIFQPFFTTKPTGHGTGLGLSLSYDIVKAHGGELRVESQTAGEAGEVRGGTVFVFYLPITPST